MRVSVLVTNHDYARFVADAVDSALDQTEPAAEVVVVDDGSTDDSRAVLARYENRVTLVLKEQGGQASAFNEGFARCTGDAVLFLDADDVLLADSIALTAGAFADHPGAAAVQHRLAVVDAAGSPTGAVLPSPHLRMPADLPAHLVRFGNYPAPPTSGNAVARWALERVMPVPEDAHRISADAYLVRAAALVGPVVATGHVGGHYRVHGANRYRQSGGLDPDRVRSQVERWEASWSTLRDAAGRWGGPALPPTRELLDVGVLAQRMVLLRREGRALDGDTRRDVARRGVAASLLDPTRSWPRRLASAAWFAGAAWGPASLAERRVR